MSEYAETAMKAPSAGWEPEAPSRFQHIVSVARQLLYAVEAVHETFLMHKRFRKMRGA